MPTRNSLADNQASYIIEIPPTLGPGLLYDLISPGASHVQLLYLSFTLACDANIANRLPWISLESAATTFPLGSPHAVQTAGSTWRYICMEHAPLNMAGAVRFRNIPLPQIRSIFPTDEFRINVDNIQVGDQISALRVQWKIWRGLS